MKAQRLRGRKRWVAAGMGGFAVLAVVATAVVLAIADDGSDDGVPRPSALGAARSAPLPVPGEIPPGPWPVEPPARICDNVEILGGGPTEPPAGAVVVPAGDNSSMRDTFAAERTTFWFAPGRHTLGPGEFDQIIPGSGSLYVGAPGAVIDGAGRNHYAFTGEAVGVVLRYLTITGFTAPRDEGVVNHNDGVGWTVEYSTVRDNSGAGLMAGAADNVYRYNCIKDNGQYGINACCAEPEAPVQNLVLDHNEITGNNTDDWESRIEGCGCTAGVKFWIDDNVTVTGNWVHDNRGTGLWLDNNNTRFVIEGNMISNNDDHAIMMEAGYDALVRYNTFEANAIVKGRLFQSGNDPFPVPAIYIANNGSPAGYGLKTVPTTISENYFVNNWGGVAMWESAERYCSSTNHTHPPYCTIKVDLYDDAQCETPQEDILPDSIGDKYRCRWSTENNLVENNVFAIDKAAIGAGCDGQDFCGVSGLFASYGTYPEFSGYEIPWRTTFQQGNVFRNNRYIGDWTFAGFQAQLQNGERVTWEEWTAPAPVIPEVFTHDNWPQTFGQDQGSSLN